MYGKRAALEHDACDLRTSTRVGVALPCWFRLGELCDWLFYCCRGILVQNLWN